MEIVPRQLSPFAKGEPYWGTGFAGRAAGSASGLAETALASVSGIAADGLPGSAAVAGELIRTLNMNTATTATSLFLNDLMKSPFDQTDAIAGSSPYRWIYGSLV
jgi:hypothetical protein